MLRKLLFPALALTLLAAEAATAQTAPAAPRAYRKARKAERVLSKREQQLAQATARAQAANQAAATAASNTTWNGWSNEPLPFTPESAAPHRAVGNGISSAPGMPLNQVGHGVSTDYNGRPLRATVASTTLSAQR